jgi:hypothetical protein
MIGREVSPFHGNWVGLWYCGSIHTLNGKYQLVFNVKSEGETLSNFDTRARAIKMHLVTIPVPLSSLVIIILMIPPSSASAHPSISQHPHQYHGIKSGILYHY